MSRAKRLTVEQRLRAALLSKGHEVSFFMWARGHWAHQDVTRWQSQGHCKCGVPGGVHVNCHIETICSWVSASKLLERGFEVVKDETDAGCDFEAVPL